MRDGLRPSLLTETRWMENARCRDLAPDWELLDGLFFREAWSEDRSQALDVEPHATRVARRLCAQCEVRSECLSHALALETVAYLAPHRDERQDTIAPTPPLGVWGGTTEAERASTRHLPKAKRLSKLRAIFENKAAEVLLPGEEAVA